MSNCELLKIISKRPVITLFTAYAVVLIVLNSLNFFTAPKRSTLYNFISDATAVSIEGKVISLPETTKNGQRFILKASKLNENSINEKLLVNAPGGYSVAYGDIISLRGKLSFPPEASFPLVFDYRKYLSRNAVYTTFKVESFEYISSSPNPVKKLAFGIRNDLIKKIDSYFKKAYADLLKPVLIGDKSSLEPEIKDSFSNAGVMHVLVVSGLHVGFIAGIFLLVFKGFGLPLKTASLISIPFLFIYVLATGANPPALRAAIMFSSVLIALSLDREPLIYNSLALSALLILIFQPQQLFTASFQMSYAATIGIVAFYNPVLHMIKPLKNSILKFFWSLFCVTVSAQIALIPVCLYYFGKISVIAFIANIIIVPLIGIILALGLLFYLFTFIFSYISLFIAVILSGLLHFILTAAILLGNLSFSSVPAPKPSVLQLIMFFSFAVILIKCGGKKRFIIPAVILLVNFYYLTFPKFFQLDKVFFEFYGGRNMSVMHVKSIPSNIFFIYRKQGYFDRYYVNSLKDFISFSGIRNPQIIAAGVDEDKLKESLKGMEITAFPLENKSYLEFNLHGNNILIDIEKDEVTLNGRITANINTNPRFYYSVTNNSVTLK